jgi:EAL domain-containing protein (putative c-di-GMP-specific phosphodiesterase class I)
MRTLRDLGIGLQQGFLFARPQLGTVPRVAWPEGAPKRAGPPALPARARAQLRR